MIANPPPPERWEPKHIRALLAARMESHAEFAKVLGVARQTVWAWATGHDSPTRPSCIRALRECYKGLDAEQRERCHRALAEIERASGGPSPEPAFWGSDARSGPDREADMRRREILEMMAAGAAGLGVSALWRTARAVEPVDGGLVDAYEREIRGLAGRYGITDPRALLPQAAGLADSLVPLLPVAPDALRGRLAAASVDAHCLTGTLAAHVGDRAGTLHYLTAADHIAAMSTDPVLRARSTAMLAKLIHDPFYTGTGDARQAVAHLGRATALGRGGDPYLRAWLWLGYAGAATRLHDVGLAQWAADRAHQEFDRAVHGHDGGVFSPIALIGGLDCYFQGVSGGIAGSAGRHDEAERVVATQIERAVGAAQRLNVTCNLAQIRVGAGEPEGACAAVADAAILAQAGFPGKLAQVRGVRLAMPAEWEGLGCMVALDEQLRAA
jgi:DNA-binding XRE family transcriptional regulator